MKKVLAFKVTSESHKEKERVEASFLEHLMKGEIPNRIENLLIGFPYHNNTCLIKNEIVVYSQDGSISDLEKRVAIDFIKKSIIDPFIARYHFKKAQDITLVDFNHSPVLFKITGKTRVTIARLLGFNKATPQQIEMKEGKNGRPYILVKSYLSKEATIASLKNWCFENSGKFRYEDIQ